MLDQEPRYERYKDSGIPWIGEVPADWQVLPGRACLYENKDKNTGMKEETVLSLSYGTVRVKPVEEQVGLVPESYETYQIVRPGDIIIRGMDLQNDVTSLRTGLAENDGIITSAYINLRPRPNVSPFYLHYLLSSYDDMKVFYGLGSGLRQNLSYTDFKYMGITVPDLDTQNRIVSFLDEKASEIDTAIAKKRRLIDLLNEQKAILINRAVIKGLNADAPMKDSGVDWIGEIPAHWELRRNQRFLRQRKEVVGKRSDDYTLLSLTLRGVIERDMENPEGKFPAKFDTYQVVRPGDFVFCHFDVEETPRTVGLSRFHGMITGAYTVYETLSPDYSEYIERLYISLDQEKLLRPLYSGLRNTIDKTVFAHTKMPVPPPDEVEKILQRISHAETETTKIVSATEREISTLNEFKQTLIANTVTGKIKI